MIFIKKISTIFIFTIFLFITPTIYANDYINIEQVYINKPNIKVYLNSDVNLLSSEISSYLDTEKLETLSVKNYKQTNYGTQYIFLVDVSKSIKNNQMKKIKESLIDFTENLNLEDKFILLSFGEKIDEVLNGSESIEEQKNKINSLKNNQEGTLFYDALNKAIEVSQKKQIGYPDRKIAFMISDGVDYNVGGYTFNEILSNLSKSNLPVYSLGINNLDKNNLDIFGNLSRSSGGKISIVSENDLYENFNKLIREIQNIYVLDLKTNSNIVTGNSENLRIIVKSDNNILEKETIVFAKNWIPDTEKPIIKSLLQNSNNSINIIFSELVSGYDNVNNYNVTNSKGVLIPVEKIIVNTNDNISIVFKDDIYKDNYTIKLTNISDISMEKNKINEDLIFSGNGKSLLNKALQDFFFKYSVLIIFLIFLFILLLIILISYSIIKKRKGIITINNKMNFAEDLEVKHYFESPQTSPLSLLITYKNGDLKKINIDMKQRFSVGRSNICNVYFDDLMLSREHFVIESNNGVFYINDLNTTNGTSVNGQKISSPTMLLNNDIITAGLEKFICLLDEVI